MDLHETLLIQLSEELGDVQHAISKCLLNGLTDVEDGASNKQYLKDELNDVFTLMDIFKELTGIELQHSSETYQALYNDKREQIQHLLPYK